MRRSTVAVYTSVLWLAAAGCDGGSDAPPTTDAAVPPTGQDGGADGATDAVGDVPQSPQPGRLTAVRAPASFAVGDPANPRLHVAVSGESLDLRSTTPVLITVSAPDGLALDVRPSHVATVGELRLMSGTVALELPDGPLPELIRVCAQAAGLEGRPCALVELARAGTPIDSDGGPGQEDGGDGGDGGDARDGGDTADVPESKAEMDVRAVERIRARLRALFPNIGCVCTRGQIRTAANEAPHDPLGQFTAAAGGNTFGESHKGTKTDATLTSTFKFEAHFEYRITGDPQKPANMTDANWAKVKALFPYLCSEGQKTNRTFTFLEGKPGQFTRDDSRNGVSYPFSATDDGTKLDWDGHGYVAPSNAAPGEAVRGALKAHAPEGVVHWLDAPGYHEVEPAAFEGLVPTRIDNYFHAFLHGTTGNPQDDCDCRLGIRSGVVDGEGRAQASSIVSPVNCTK
jgi:hypothetical protein